LLSTLFELFIDAIDLYSFKLHLLIIFVKVIFVCD
jgi:hypothetical protein